MTPYGHACEFQSTPPRGGRPRRVAHASIADVFQSTPPRGGRRRPASSARQHRSVSIHAPARGATCDADRLSRRPWFQSTPPRGGRPALATTSRPIVRRFNPRPRAGGDSAAARPARHTTISVSIHAPARGATRSRSVRDRRNVSIHAPARGATGPTGARSTAIACFNPRPRAGGDLSDLRVERRDVEVSIHAPARGATRACRSRRSGRYEFQSTPPRGGRPDRAAARQLDAMFQSTPPRGGRLQMPSALSAARSCFNPRPRAGGDRMLALVNATVSVSIHAPARGATVAILNPFQRAENYGAGANPSANPAGKPAATASATLQPLLHAQE